MNNKPDNLHQVLKEDIKALLEQTSLSPAFKQKVVDNLPKLSESTKIYLKQSLLVRLLVETEFEVLKEKKKKGKTFSTRSDVEELAKETLNRLIAKEDKAISSAEASLIGKSLKGKTTG